MIVTRTLAQWRGRVFREVFSGVLLVATLLHFMVVSIKPLLVVCCYRFPVNLEFIVIIFSLGNRQPRVLTSKGGPLLWVFMH